MKSKVLAITLLATTTIIGYTGTTFASDCGMGETKYTAEGSIITENVSSNLQIGSISLTLLNEDSDKKVFDSGSLVGNVTGAEGPGVILLSHVARFSQGNSFVTNDDRAVVVGFRDFLPDGITPCSFFIHENISEISRGTRFFRNVTDVEVFADGYIDNCPGNNGNYFEISGDLCVE